MRISFHSIRAKLLILQGFFIAAILAAGLLSAYGKRATMIEGYETTIKSMVESSISVLKSYDERAAKGEFTKEEAQTRAKDTLRALRFLGQEYVFGFEYDGNSVFHGAKRDVENTKKLADFRDSNGILPIRELLNRARAGGGFVIYNFPKAGGTEPFPKLSYAANYEPWGWMIGTGVYIDDVDAAFRSALLETLAGTLVAALLVGLFGYRLIAHVANGLDRIASATGAIARGDLATMVEGAERRDEVGALARSVDALRLTAIEAAQLRSRQASLEAQAADERRAAMNRFADEFERNVGGLVRSVADAAAKLSDTSSAMSRGAGETTQLVDTAAQAANHTSGNVNAVAGATEQLAASIREIAQQVAESTAGSTRAVEDVRRTYQLIEQLDTVAKRTVEVVDLIRSIAEQTNLLALNATIEAARAGEAGKGFAVVASEVKNLANQTAKATDDVQAQIGAMTSATASVVEAMRGVGGVIETVNSVASSISAAIEEQGSATRAISTNVNEAAHGVGSVSNSLTMVCDHATATGRASTEVAAAARDVGTQTERMRSEVSGFLAKIRQG
ncbi:methyl-accepting chemotaxis protein [Azospirillum doebereinerae]|uniref:Methyl-accepting chemotaxis protein n=1 Tax=Azospirillum doebereinerae TaxID=92933 RepID=A0A3S0V502_9PROT|nr:cache domain-containing protein [Azospirillum doebereinerae]MCG5240799.1 cache domain-containing protein [Azospirillum doebereinerae]RUQ67523.1 methyl-accepting chemotaxis protein [Azospirillum doebereinerae]